MKRLLAPSALALALLSAAALPAQAAIATTSFNMVPSAGAKTCLHGANAEILLTTDGPFEDMTVIATALPAHTIFTLFMTQLPNSPFGLSSYIGDIRVDATGLGVGHFVGRFSRASFMVSPGVAAAPQEFTKGQFPDAKQGAKVGPVQLYHLGLWFNSSASAVQ